MELSIRALGEARHPSPLQLSTVSGDSIADFTPPDARVFLDPTQASPRQPSFELAGPRALNYFRGPEVTAAIVTVGGLCPGMNNVVRELVLTLWHRYGVRRILGARYGFRGLLPDSPEPLQALDPGVVRDIHLQGGTVLGSSRGPQPVNRILDLLQQRGIDMVFCIGGDGGMNGARALYEETRRRAAPIAVVGVPKTIDNDLPYIERTFGFDTAVSIASGAIRAAHVEARSAPNGVGLVRLMGRHAGFIAAAATLAAREVNLVLVPELPFAIEGERGLLAWLWQRLDRRDHAVIVVAEGAGQEHLTGAAGRDASGRDASGRDASGRDASGRDASGRDASGRDASGNVKLGDIGVFLRDRLIAAGRSRDLQLKYIDPSYIIRATPATPSDAIFCGDLAESAVHAAMAGKTGLVIGLWLNRLTHLPLATATDGRKTISLDGPFWRSVINCTGQPAQLV